MMYSAATKTPIITALKAPYGITSDIDSYLTHHLESMKKSVNKTIEQAGRGLDAAKLGAASR